MEAAVAEYAELLSGPNEWLVRRFVCPVAWLPDLLNQMPAKVDEPWSISVLGTSLDGYRQDLNAIERFEELAAGRALAECYEVKANRTELNRPALKHLADAGFEEVFIELPWTDELEDALHQIVEVEGIGVKGRTGGLEPGAFPSNERLAQFIHECISLDLEFKLTAGLHHPVPTQDTSIPARMHGFLNVLMATTMGLTHDLRRADLAAILASDDSKSLWFTEKGAGFQDWEADLSDLQAARASFISWGSCSVQEPLDDLAALHLT